MPCWANKVSLFSCSDTYHKIYLTLVRIGLNRLQQNQMESEESKLLNIHVTICDRPYRLKVRPEEEETVRKAARTIAEKIKELQNQFAGSDKQDYLAMALLTAMVEQLGAHKQSISQASDDGLAVALDTLNQQLADALQQWSYSRPVTPF